MSLNAVHPNDRNNAEFCSLETIVYCIAEVEMKVDGEVGGW